MIIAEKQCFNLWSLKFFPSYSELIFKYFYLRIIEPYLKVAKARKIVARDTVILKEYLVT